MNTNNISTHSTETSTDAATGSQLAIDAFMAIRNGTSIASIARQSANALINDGTDQNAIFSEELAAFIQQLMEMLVPKKLTKLMEISDRFDKNGNITYDEIGEILVGADQETIDAVEKVLADAGEAPLPQNINPGSPEFHAVAEKMIELHEAGTNNDNPEYIEVFQALLRLAPPWLKMEFRNKANVMGLMPKPDYVTETGESAFSVACIAEHLGKSEAEVIEDIQKLEVQGVVTGSVFRIH
jgi:hypothetical protein